MFSMRQCARLLVRGGMLASALALIVAVLAVAFVEVGRRQTVVLPVPTGSSPVGRAAYDWVDNVREDSLAPAGGRKRELLVWVWYPASRVAPDTVDAEYIPPDWRSTLEEERGFIGTQLFQDLAAVQVHAVANAGLSGAQRQYPLLIFMPGYGNVVPTYTALAEGLASHGYVVAGINPTYTATVVFPDGRVTRRTPVGTIPETSDVATTSAADRLVGVWASDARFVLDRLAELNAEPGGEFAGRLDLTRIGVLGHSLGGAAALEACRQDSRCRAGMDMDGTLYGDVARLGLEQPVMFLVGGGTGSSELAEQHRMPVEEDKAANERGKYLYPAAYGQPESIGIEALGRPLDSGVPGR